MSTPNHPNPEKPDGMDDSEQVTANDQSTTDAAGPQPSIPKAVPPQPAMPPGRSGEPAEQSRAAADDPVEAPPKHNGHPPPAPPPWQRETPRSEPSRSEQPRPEPPRPEPPRPETPPARPEPPREPQREPQSNLYRPGQPPVKGRPNAGTGIGDGQSPSRSLSEMAAKAARKEAAMVKSVGIDGPTRSIARPELIKDMPDLSELRHPTPAAVPPAPRMTDTGPQPMINTGGFAAVPSTSTGPLPVVMPDGEPLRTTVQLRRIDPWSTLKASLVVSVVVFFVWMIAVGLLYLVLDGMGVWGHLNNLFASSGGDSSDAILSAGQVFGYASLIGLLNIVLMTGIATIGAFIYNQCADIVGGIQVTLADPD